MRSIEVSCLLCRGSRTPPHVLGHPCQGTPLLVNASRTCQLRFLTWKSGVWVRDEPRPSNLAAYATAAHEVVMCLCSPGGETACSSSFVKKQTPIMHQMLNPKGPQQFQFGTGLLEELMRSAVNAIFPCLPR
jgi:hypothetical protein